MASPTLRLSVIYILLRSMLVCVGKTGYYCLLDSMELLLSLWLNRSVARPFASFDQQKIASRLELISVCVCVCVNKWGLYENPSARFCRRPVLIANFCLRNLSHKSCDLNGLKI